jgi:putative transposase
MFETMEHHDEYLGRRIKRGMFKSSTGKLINADINGAIGIMRKAKEISDDNIVSLRDRGDIVSPKVLNI